MGIGTQDPWEIHWAREQLKETFGNRRNWERFCMVADEMAFRVWLSTI